MILIQVTYALFGLGMVAKLTLDLIRKYIKKVKIGSVKDEGSPDGKKRGSVASELSYIN